MPQGDLMLTWRRCIKASKPADGWPQSWLAYGADLRDLPTPKPGVHCFTDDRRFNSLWTTELARQRLSERVNVCCAPDFSIDPILDPTVVMWQIHRSGVVASDLIERGMTVVPTLQWGPRVDELLEFMCLGIQSGSWVAVRSPDDAGWIRHWRECIDAVCEEIKPAGILWTGREWHGGDRYPLQRI